MSERLKRFLHIIGIVLAVPVIAHAPFIWPQLLIALGSMLVSAWLLASAVIYIRDGGEEGGTFFVIGLVALMGIPVLSYLLAIVFWAAVGLVTGDMTNAMSLTGELHE